MTATLVAPLAVRSRRVFWAANVRTESFTDRLAARVAGGFREMSIFPIDGKTFADGGLPPDRLRRLAADEGARIGVLDPYARWVPDATPAPWATASDLAFVEFEEDAILRMAEALGVDSINLIETFGNRMDVDACADADATWALRGDCLVDDLLHHGNARGAHRVIPR